MNNGFDVGTPAEHVVLLWLLVWVEGLENINDIPGVAKITGL